MSVDTHDVPQQAATRPGDADLLTTRDLLGATTPGELDLFPFLLLIRSHLPRTILCALVGLLIAAGYTYTRKPRYSATASILIPQGNGGSASSAVLQAATGLDLLGGGYEVYMDILHSRAIEDRLIQQFNLQQHYGVNRLEAAEGILYSRSFMFAAKEGLLWVTVQDEDPKMAADLANAYFTELSQLNARLGITAAGQLRHYYEGEMLKEKDALADAEVALEQNQVKNGALEPQSLAGYNLSAADNTRAQLRAREIDLQGLLQGATPQNPSVVRLQAQIEQLKRQLGGLESGGGPEAGTPAAQQPGRVLEFIRKQRDVKFHEALMDMLTRNYETARQQESKDISLVEVLDPARPQFWADWPPKHTWLAVGAVAGLVVGILWTALQAVLGTVMGNQQNRVRLEALIHGRGTVAGGRRL